MLDTRTSWLIRITRITRMAGMTVMIRKTRMTLMSGMTMMTSILVLGITMLTGMT